MKAKARSRFDIDRLRERAGEKVFSRGEAYHRSGQVEILSLTPSRVVAQVAGTEDYRTVLTGRGADIHGECSCPAFEDWGFCKHMIATALAANAAGDDAAAETALSRIREHLKTWDIDALVDLILAQAERDPELLRELELKSTIAGADDKTLEARLRKAIDVATRTGSYVDYREASRWRDGVEAALDAVAKLASGERAGLALKLVDHAIERIEAASGAIDDSDGHIGDLLYQAHEIHLAAVHTVRPEPIAFARELFRREMRDDIGGYTDAVMLYADVLGEAGLAEYRRLAAEAWEKLPAGSSRKRDEAEVSNDRHRLKDILDFFAERDGDVEARIALRAGDLSSQWAYLQLAEFCAAQGRKEEALRRAEEGLWVFEDDRPDQRLLSFAVDLLIKAGRKADAEAHLWRAFEKSPNLGAYQQLRKVGGEPAGQRAVALLEARLANRKRVDWDSPANLLVKIFIEEKRFDAAWSVVQNFGAFATEELARASEAQFPREALAVYTAQVEQLVRNGAYPEAVKLIVHMATLRSAREQTTFVLELKVRHGRKRNLMKLLK